MPMYDYKCPVCLRGREMLLRQEQLQDIIKCGHCGSAMNRQLSAPYVRGDYEPYESPVVPGKIISGRREHEEHLRETGCRILEPGETSAYRHSLKQEEEKLERKVEETVEAEIHSMPTEKRERLIGEIQGGMTTEVVRDTPTFNK